MPPREGAYGIRPARAAEGLSRAATAVLWVLVIGVATGLAVLAAVMPPVGEDGWAFPLYASIVMTWTISGALLASRRPDNRVGWVLVVAGLCMGVALIGQLWAYISVASWGGALPLTVAGAMLGLLFNPSLLLAFLVPLLFPNGRLMSRRWAAVVALVFLSMAAVVTGTVLRPGPIEGMQLLDNPFGVPALAGLAQTLNDLGGMGSLLCLPAGMAAAILRYRRGTPIERRQLKWFGSALLLSFSLFFGAVVLPQPLGQMAWFAASLSLGLVPVAILVAILRYRLYEIDRIVSRTISYALVTGILATVFIGTNLALQSLVASATGESTLAIAGSTLLVAALFQPVRRRIQAGIDRRFNRARSDAERVVGAFTARTRDQVDLTELRRTVVASTRDAVHPSGSALWLRRTG